MKKEEFLQNIENFLKSTKMSATMFSLKTTKQPGFVSSVRKGRECREAIREKVLRFIEEYQRQDKRD